MCLQKEVLNQYIELKRSPTLKFISEDTGIQLTRIFRLLHGAEMKLKEFEIFREKINVELGNRESLIEIARHCEEILSKKGISSLKAELERMLQLKELVS